MNARHSAETVAAFYTHAVAPSVAEIEARRKSAVNTFTLLAGAAIILNAFAAALLWYGGYYSKEPNLLYVSLLAAIGSAHLAGWPLRSFRAETKTQLLEKILPLFEGFALDESGRAPGRLLMRAALFPVHDHDRGGNSIYGVYRDVEIYSVDAKLIKEVRHKGRKSEVEVFTGTVYTFTFPKIFHGDVRLRADRGWLGNRLEGVFDKLQRVTLEDPVFENTFEVYAADQIEARYLLTTGFMERLLHIARRNPDGLEAAFFDNKLLLKITRDNLRFTVTNPLRRIDWRAEVLRFVDEFQDALAMVDELKLNQRIGL